MAYLIHLCCAIQVLATLDGNATVALERLSIRGLAAAQLSCHSDRQAGKMMIWHLERPDHDGSRHNVSLAQWRQWKQADEAATNTGVPQTTANWRRALARWLP